MHRVEFEDFLLIAEDHSGIPAETLLRMDRVRTLGLSALAAPFAGFGDFELHPSLAEKAAIYCARISNYQPLPDGNKRTGYTVMRAFLMLNGAEFVHPPEGRLETARMIEGVSGGGLPEAEFVAWVAAHVKI